MRTRAILVLFLVVAASAVWAQNPQAKWDNLKQLRRGQRTNVVEMNLSFSVGKFLRHTDTELVMQVGSNEVSIPRKRVFRVSEHRSRGRNALYGGIAGAGLGALVGLTREGKSADYPKLICIWGGGTALFSAAITTQPTVYLAERPAASQAGTAAK